MWRLLKRLGERALVSILSEVGIRARGRAIVLAYHNVVPSGNAPAGDRSLHLPLRTFQAQLDALSDVVRFVPLQALLAGERDRDRAVVAISFDDAYRGAIELAVPELIRRGIPATVFVAPGLLDRAAFWWDELASPEDGLDDSVRSAALLRCEGREDLVHSVLYPTSTTTLSDWHSGASLEQLRRLAASSDLVTFGAHSVSHPNLTAVSDEMLRDELSGSRDWLLSSGLPAVDLLAYPYGLSDSRVHAAAAAAGFSAAFEVSGAWLVLPDAAPWCLPRLNVPSGMSPDGLALRLSGLLRG